MVYQEQETTGGGVGVLEPCLGEPAARRDEGGRSLSKFGRLGWDPRPSRSALLRDATLACWMCPGSVWVTGPVENC
jgi:hypothetical protein